MPKDGLENLEAQRVRVQKMRLADGRIRVAGWVARTRPLAEPLSPRGPQPVLRRLRGVCGALNGPLEPVGGVPQSWYSTNAIAPGALLMYALYLQWFNRQLHGKGKGKRY